MCAQGGIFSKKEVRLLVAGLDSAGKTSTRPKLAAVKSFEIAAMKEDGCRARWPPHVCMCVHSAAASPMYALSHTAIFYKLKHGKRRLAEPVNTIPTLDFNVDSCRHRTHSSHTCTTLHIHTCIHVCVCLSVSVSVCAHRCSAAGLNWAESMRRGPLSVSWAHTELPLSRCRLNKVRFSIWDVGGQESIRPLWRHYYTGTQVTGGVLARGGASHCSYLTD